MASLLMLLVSIAIRSNHNVSWRALINSCHCYIIGKFTLIVSCQLHNTSPPAHSHSIFIQNRRPDPNQLAPGAHSYFEKLQVLALLPISYLWSQVLQSYVVVQKLWWPGVATLSCLHVHLMKSQSQKLGSAFTEMHGLNA